MREEIAAEAERVAGEIVAQPPASPEAIASLLGRVAERQKSVGYGGDFDAWIEEVTPPDFA